MEKEKQKNKSQARKRHTNWNTSSHCLTFWNMIGTMYRKGDEDVRHTDIQHNYTRLLLAGPGTATCSTWRWLRMEWKQTRRSAPHIPWKFWIMQKYCRDKCNWVSDKWSSAPHCLFLRTEFSIPNHTPIPNPKSSRARLLDKCKIYIRSTSQSTGVPQMPTLKVPSKGRRHNKKSY